MVVRNATTDTDYYARRAEQERALALRCQDQAASLAHLKLAAEYDKRLAIPREPA